MTPMVDTAGKRLKNGEVLSFYKVNYYVRQWRPFRSCHHVITLSTFPNYTILTGIASGCHGEAQDVGRGAKDADVAADPGIPLRHDLPLRADRALPRLRNLQRHATHGGLQVVAPATSKLGELLILK